MPTPKHPREPLPFSEVEFQELEERERSVVESMSRDNVIAGLKFLANIDPEKMVAASLAERKERTERLKKLAHEQGTLPLGQLKNGDTIVIVLEKPPKPPTVLQLRIDAFFDRTATQLGVKPRARELGKKALGDVRDMFAFAKYPTRYVHAIVESVDQENGRVLLGCLSDSNLRNIMRNEIGPKSIHRDRATVLALEDKFTIAGSVSGEPNATDDFQGPAGLGALRQGDRPMISMHAATWGTAKEHVADLESMIVSQFSLNAEYLFPQPRV